MMAENRYNDETYGLHFDFAFDADMEVTGLDRPSKEANSGVRLDEDILDDYENETLAEYKNSIRAEITQSAMKHTLTRVFTITANRKNWCINSTHG